MKKRRGIQMRTEVFCFGGGCRLLLIYAVTFRVSLLISGTFRRENSPAFRCEPRVPASGDPRWTEVSAGEPAEEPAAPPW